MKTAIAYSTAILLALSTSACGSFMNPDIQQNSHPKMRYDIAITIEDPPGRPPMKTDLFLLFDKTKDMLQRWLFYIIGTLFSMAVLSVVVSMCLNMSLRVAAALWGAKIVNSILGNGPEGLSSQALQQGGIGLLLTVLIISVPPIMGTIFQGTVGNYLTYAAFGGGGMARPGPQGQPAGSYQPPTAPGHTNSGKRSSQHYNSPPVEPRITPQNDAIKKRDN